MNLSFLTRFFTRPAPKPPTVKQQGIQARAIRHLIAHDVITAWDIIQMGTTDAHKMLTRMRRMGVLYDADDCSGHHVVKNASGHGHHRRHYWTGKLPPKWSWADCERRKTPRKN